MEVSVLVITMKVASVLGVNSRDHKMLQTYKEPLLFGGVGRMKAFEV